MTKMPSHKELKKPLLALLRRRGEISMQDALDHIAVKFALSTKAQKAMQGCGKESVLQNRIRWARWELQREGKVETTRRGYFRLTPTDKESSPC